MEFSTLLLGAVVVALVVWIIFGDKLKVSPKGIEVDTEGLLKYLREAEAQKGLAPEGNVTELEKVSAQVKAISQRLPVGTVLWIDDHPLNNQKEKMALAQLGLFADSYTTNAEALAALKTGDYDIVISDIGREADETGWDLLRDVHRLYPKVPFIFYTMNITDRARKEATDAGARGIVERPGELITLVVNNLRPRR